MITVVGMDPGPHTGLVKLAYSERQLIRVNVLQVSDNIALDCLQLLLTQNVGASKGEIYFQTEKFVVGNKSYRTGSYGARTRDQVGSSLVLAQSLGAHTSSESASDAKQWATDDRLQAAGLLDLLTGMGHARDATRHALRAACRNAAIPDPYSREARKYRGN